MKSCNIIFVVLILSVAVKGAWWATATQPIILSIGAAFAALNLNADLISDIQPTALINLFSKDKVAEELKKKKTDPIERMLMYDEEYRNKIQSILGDEKSFLENQRDIENKDPTAMKKLDDFVQNQQKE